MSKSAPVDDSIERHSETNAVEKKLKLSFELFALAFNIKRHQLSQKHLDLDDDELDRRTYACFERAK